MEFIQPIAMLRGTPRLHNHPTCVRLYNPTELVQKNHRSLFDWRKIIKCESLIFENGHAQYHLPYHKGNPFYRETDVIFTSQDIANPVLLLQDYMVLCDSIHGTKTALFLQENGSHPSHYGLILNFSQFWIDILVDTLHAQGTPHFWLH